MQPHWSQVEKKNPEKETKSKNLDHHVHYYWPWFGFFKKTLLNKTIIYWQDFWLSYFDKPKSKFHWQQFKKLKQKPPQQKEVKGKEGKLIRKQEQVLETALPFDQNNFTWKSLLQSSAVFWELLKLEESVSSANLLFLWCGLHKMALMRFSSRVTGLSQLHSNLCWGHPGMNSISILEK